MMTSELLKKVQESIRINGDVPVCSYSPYDEEPTESEDFYFDELRNVFVVD